MSIIGDLIEVAATIVGNLIISEDILKGDLTVGSVPYIGTIDI